MAYESDLLNLAAPSSAVVEVTDSQPTASENLTLTATSEEVLNATFSNTMASAAAAIVNATGESNGLVLASNKVHGEARVTVSDQSGSSKSPTAGGSLSITATDDITLHSNTKLVTSSETSNDGGLSVLGNFDSSVRLADWVAEDPTTAGTQEVTVKYGHRVRRANWSHVYLYVGDDQTIDINNADYLEKGFWREESLGLKPIGNGTNSDSKAVGVLFVHNDLRSSAIVEVDDASLNATSGDITVTSDLSSSMTSNIDAGITSSGGSVIGVRDRRHGVG